MTARETTDAKGFLPQEFCHRGLHCRIFLLCVVVIPLSQIHLDFEIDVRDEKRQSRNAQNDETVCDQTAKVVLNIFSGSGICEFDAEIEGALIELQCLIQTGFAAARDSTNQAHPRREDGRRRRGHDGGDTGTDGGRCGRRDFGASLSRWGC